MRNSLSTLAVKIFPLLCFSFAASELQAEAGGRFVKSPSASYVNVRQFGAQGNGKRDDTESINLAIRVAQIRRTGVYFPPGLYTHSGIIKVIGTVKLLGSGQVTQLIATNPNAAAVQFASTAQAGISSMSLSCPAGVGSYNHLPESSAIYIVGSGGTTVSQVFVREGFSQGIQVTRSSSVNINYSQFTPSDGVALQITGSNAVVVYANSFFAQGTNVDRFIGLYTEPTNSGLPSTGVTLLHNYMTGDVATAAISINSATNCTVENNTISFPQPLKHTGYGIFAHADKAVPNSQVDGILVTENAVYNTNRHGIVNRFIGAQGIAFWDFNNVTPHIGNVTVTNNTLGNIGGNGIFFNTAVEGSFPVVSISGNSIDTTQFTGMASASGFGKFTATNNRIVNAGTTAISMSPGLPATSINVSNNVAQNVRSSVFGAYYFTYRLSPLPALTVTNNTYAGTNPGFFIFTDASGAPWPTPPAVFSGNVSTPPYPSRL